MPQLKIKIVISRDVTFNESTMVRQQNQSPHTVDDVAYTDGVSQKVELETPEVVSQLV